MARKKRGRRGRGRARERTSAERTPPEGTSPVQSSTDGSVGQSAPGDGVAPAVEAALFAESTPRPNEVPALEAVESEVEAEASQPASVDQAVPAEPAATGGSPPSAPASVSPATDDLFADLAESGAPEGRSAPADALEPDESDVAEEDVAMQDVAAEDVAEEDVEARDVAAEDVAEEDVEAQALPAPEQTATPATPPPPPPAAKKAAERKSTRRPSIVAFREGASVGPVYRRPAGQRIVAFGGGKGGAGRTVLVANIGIYLAQLGKKVVLVDAALGVPTLHTFLGMELPPLSLTDFLEGRASSLDTFTQPTDIPGLSLVPGTGELGNPNLRYQQEQRLLERIRTLDVDVVLVDLAAGTSAHTLDFFLAADRGVIVLMPELTSIECAYRFLKNVFFRNVFGPGIHEGEAPRTRKLLEIVAQREGDDIFTPLDLINELEILDRDSGAFLRRQLSRFRPYLLVNQARTTADGRLPDGLRSVCRRRFGVEVEVLGPVDFDDSVWHSIRRRRPLVLEYPDSSAAKAIGALARKLIASQTAAERSRLAAASGG